MSNSRGPYGHSTHGRSSYHAPHSAAAPRGQPLKPPHEKRDRPPSTLLRSNSFHPSTAASAPSGSIKSSLSASSAVFTPTNEYTGPTLSTNAPPFHVPTLTPSSSASNTSKLVPGKPFTPGGMSWSPSIPSSSSLSTISANAAPFTPTLPSSFGGTPGQYTEELESQLPTPRTTTDTSKPLKSFQCEPIVLTSSPTAAGLSNVDMRLVCHLLAPDQWPITSDEDIQSKDGAGAGTATPRTRASTAIAAPLPDKATSFTLSSSQPHLQAVVVQPSLVTQSFLQRAFAKSEMVLPDMAANASLSTFGLPSGAWGLPSLPSSSSASTSSSLSSSPSSASSWPLLSHIPIAYSATSAVTLQSFPEQPRIHSVRLPYNPPVEGCVMKPIVTLAYRLYKPLPLRLYNAPPVTLASQRHRERQAREKDKDRDGKDRDRDAAPLLADGDLSLLTPEGEERLVDVVWSRGLQRKCYVCGQLATMQCLSSVKARVPFMQTLFCSMQCLRRHWERHGARITKAMLHGELPCGAALAAAQPRMYSFEASAAADAAGDGGQSTLTQSEATVGNTSASATSVSTSTSTASVPSLRSVCGSEWFCEEDEHAAMARELDALQQQHVQYLYNNRHNSKLNALITLNNQATLHVSNADAPTSAPATAASSPTAASAHAHAATAASPGSTSTSASTSVGGGFPAPALSAPAWPSSLSELSAPSLDGALDNVLAGTQSPYTASNALSASYPAVPSLTRITPGSATAPSPAASLLSPSSEPSSLPPSFDSLPPSSVPPALHIPGTGVPALHLTPLVSHTSTDPVPVLDTSLQDSYLMPFSWTRHEALCCRFPAPFTDIYTLIGHGMHYTPTQDDHMRTLRIDVAPAVVVEQPLPKDTLGVVASRRAPRTRTPAGSVTASTASGSVGTSGASTEAPRVFLDPSLVQRWLRVETAPVQRLPVLNVQRKRLAPVRKLVPPHSHGFKVLHYNILSDHLASPQLYYYCPPWALTWEYRRKLILQEITSHNADILCLQEVPAGQYDWLAQELSAHGYAGKFLAKTRYSQSAFSAQDGCATFYRKERFRFRECREIRFDDLATQYLHSKMMPHERAAVTAAQRRVMRGNVCLVLALEVASGPQNKLICVANTHLFWDPSCADVKLLQTWLLLRELSLYYDHSPIILSGDFNSTPDSSVYELLVTQAIKRPYSELATATYLPSPGELRHGLPLASAYAWVTAQVLPTLPPANPALVPSAVAEPAFTNYTAHFKGTLDYILFSPHLLVCTEVLQVDDEDALAEFGALPSPCRPSDHICLVATFDWL